MAPAFIHYTVSNHWMNEDHKNIFDHLEQLKSNPNQEDAEKFLKLIEEHFLHEEKVMELFGYPLSKHHKDEHTSLIFKAKKSVFDSLMFSAFTADKLMDAFLNHIEWHDAPLDKWLEENDKNF